MKVTSDPDGLRVKGLRGLGARGKSIVFGLFKRNGHVYTEIVPDCSKRTLQDIIRGRVELESIIHSDGWMAYSDMPLKILKVCLYVIA